MSYDLICSIDGMENPLIDVKIAFLNGELKEEVYIEKQEGFIENIKESHMCRFKKALYGLK